MVKKTAIFVIESYIDIIIPALTFVVGLAWNSAFQKYFERDEELNKYGHWVYAFVVTFIILMLIIFLKKIKRII